MTIPDEILDLDLVKIGMYIYIKRKCGKAGECDVSMKELGERFGLTRPTTSRYLTELYNLKVLFQNGHQTDTKRTLITLKPNGLDSIGGHQTDTKRTPEQELKERKLAFGMQLKPFSGTYPRPMLVEFYNYWTEVKEGGRKMRFEKEKTFEIAKRLARWSKNNYGKSSSEQRMHTDGTVLHAEQMDYTKGTW
nr:MAG TPA: Transcriptional regulator, MarR/EmrR family, emrR, transcriptional regulator, DNA-binding [Caudoviricetes sp.]